MGYTTTFTGRIDLSRELTAREAQAIRDFAEERHGGDTRHDPQFPGFWCQWVPTKDGTGIVWDGGEKFYDAFEWMRIVIDRFIAPAGIVANGEVLAQGENPSDVWQLRVTDNKVTRINGRVVFEEA